MHANGLAYCTQLVTHLCRLDNLGPVITDLLLWLIVSQSLTSQKRWLRRHHLQIGFNVIREFVTSVQGRLFNFSFRLWLRSRNNLRYNSNDFLWSATLLGRFARLRWG